jgi:protocatechuate 3,4-dioxygenase beta subunit
MPPSPTAVLNPGFTCLPTESSELDHTYAPGAPERQSVGQGYVLSGVVKSAEDCSPIPGAQIELWLPNANGDFDDAHRARLLTDSDGRYRFESDGSQANAGIPIHIRVVAEGFGELVTQHFPVAGQTSATLDLVMVPTR